jgi:hypothetical protein
MFPSMDLSALESVTGSPSSSSGGTFSTGGSNGITFNNGPSVQTMAIVAVALLAGFYLLGRK